MKLIEGVEYYTTAEVVRVAGISRQTLWRWRKEKRVPQGHTFRSRGVLFSRSETRPDSVVREPGRGSEDESKPIQPPLTEPTLTP